MAREDTTGTIVICHRLPTGTLILHKRNGVRYTSPLEAGMIRLIHLHLVNMYVRYVTSVLRSRRSKDNTKKLEIAIRGISARYHRSSHLFQMSAQAGPGPSTSFYMQAQKQNGNNTNNNAPIGNAGTSGAANSNGSVLAPIGGTAEDVAPGEPNTFTDAQLEEFKEQDRYLPVSRR